MSGSSRIVVPVNRSRPNNAPMNNSGAQIHLVNPSESGPPMAKPMNPAACARPAGVSGEPAHRCHRPSAGSAIIAAPSTSRGRASGFGSVRINSTATAAVTTGSATTAEPMKMRTTESTHAPTGRAASNQELAAMTTARPSSARAIPSRRWPGSISRARPTDRAVLPVPLASISHVARTARPHASPALVTSEWLRRLAGRRGALAGLRAGLRRGCADREEPFDLLVRAPERATVLLAMRQA